MVEAMAASAVVVEVEAPSSGLAGAVAEGAPRSASAVCVGGWRLVPRTLASCPPQANHYATLPPSLTHVGQRAPLQERARVGSTNVWVIVLCKCVCSLFNDSLSPCPVGVWRPSLTRKKTKRSYSDVGRLAPTLHRCERSRSVGAGVCTGGNKGAPLFPHRSPHQNSPLPATYVRGWRARACVRACARQKRIHTTLHTSHAPAGVGASRTAGPGRSLVFWACPAKNMVNTIRT